MELLFPLSVMKFSQFNVIDSFEFIKNVRGRHIANDAKISQKFRGVKLR